VREQYGSCERLLVGSSAIFGGFLTQLRHEKTQRRKHSRLNDWAARRERTQRNYRFYNGTLPSRQDGRRWTPIAPRLGPNNRAPRNVSLGSVALATQCSWSPGHPIWGYLPRRSQWPRSQPAHRRARDGHAPEGLQASPSYGCRAGSMIRRGLQTSRGRY